MRTFIALTITTLTLAGCATSTQQQAVTSTHANHGAAVTSTQAQVDRTGTPKGSSGNAFCKQARQIGLRNLAATDGSNGQNPATELAGIDRLAAIAPTDIRADFTMFDKFEHAVVDAAAGRRADMAKLNTPRLSAALEHVGRYFVDICHISQ